MTQPLYIGLIALLSLVTLVADCSCSKKLVVSRVLLDRMPSAEEFPLGRPELKAIVFDALGKNPNIKHKEADNDEGTLRVRLRIEQAELGNNTKSQTLIVSLKYTRSVGDELEQHFGSGSIAIALDSTPKQIFAKALALAVDDLMSSWRGEELSTAAMIATVERYLAGEDVAENALLQSIYLLGVKKEKKAVKPLCSLLTLYNQRASLAALNALTSIGDPAAVEAITQFAERKPSEIRLQAISALRQMGGPKAAAWLFTMSTGHEDPEVRSVAESALKDVEKRLGK